MFIATKTVLNAISTMKVFVNTAVLLVILVGVNSIPLKQVRERTFVVTSKFYDRIEIDFTVLVLSS